MMNLFDDFIREDQSKIEWGGNVFSYLNNSARSEITYLRNLIESWFQNYPIEHQNELKTRLHKKQTFESSLFELIIYTYFTNLGFLVIIHHELEGTTFRPDFRVQNETEDFYVEVKHLELKSKSEIAAENLRNTLYNTLDKTITNRFLFAFDKFEIKSSRAPNGKKIAKEFSKIMKLRIHLTDSEVLGEKLNYEDETVFIEYKLMPVLEQYRGKLDGAIGMLADETEIGGRNKQIIKGLESKGSKYGKLNRPFLICLNCSTPFFTPLTINMALYGDIIMETTISIERFDSKPRYLLNGFFGNKHFPKNRNVSAVLATRINLETLFGAEFYLRHHHNPFFPFDLRLDNSLQEALKIKTI